MNALIFWAKLDCGKYAIRLGVMKALWCPDTQEVRIAVCDNHALTLFWTGSTFALSDIVSTDDKVIFEQLYAQDFQRYLAGLATQVGLLRAWEEEERDGDIIKQHWDGPGFRLWCAFGGLMRLNGPDMDVTVWVKDRVVGDYEWETSIAEWKFVPNDGEELLAEWFLRNRDEDARFALAMLEDVRDED